MPDRRFTIINKLGLHARAAAKLVATATRFRADIHVERGAQRVNGKSIMGIMMLAAGKGSELELCAKGKDEREALEALAGLVQERFGEAE